MARDLAALRQTLTAAQALGAAKVTVATSNSLQHVPHDTALETWDDATLNENLHAWLAFADQKVLEVVIRPIVGAKKNASVIRNPP